MPSVRRAIPLLAVAATLLAACGTRHETVEGAPESDPAYDESFDSQSARTRAMEEKAAEIEQLYQDAMADENASEAEKIRAYQEFERERQKLNEMGAGADDDSDDDDG